MGTPTPPGETADSFPVSGAIKESAKVAGYGLRREALSPMETLAQSISTIAPTLTPVATIPLVCALAGNGTWLAYVLATGAILLVAWCVGRFARYSSSPGSLYSYASTILPPWLAAAAAWSLLLAYVATGASVLAGFCHYANVMLRDVTGHPTSALLLATIVTGGSMWIAWRDVKISARLMLWIEAVSVTLIFIVVVLVQARHGLRVDLGQLQLRGVTGSGLRLGLVLALFSFVGFESATTLGAEARNPLKAIPRAVLQSSILSGAFFIFCAYTEVLGFRMAGQDLGSSEVPMHVLAAVGGMPILGLLIDAGALVSFFAWCSLASRRRPESCCSCLTTDSPMVRFAPRTRETKPPVARLWSQVWPRSFPVAILGARGASGLDVYGWMGALATYGFIVTYGLVCFALPGYLRDHHGIVNATTKTIPWLAFVAMLLALAGNLYPVPAGPYGKLPYIYLAYLAIVLLWFLFQSRVKAAAQGES